VDVIEIPQLFEAVKLIGALGRTIDFYSVRTVGHYVVRPETLQPYSMQVVKSLEQRGSGQNQSYATKQEAGWSSTFAWPE